MRYLIEFYTLGPPGITLRYFKLDFDSIDEAIKLAESIFKKNEGYCISHI